MHSDRLLIVDDEPRIGDLFRTIAVIDYCRAAWTLGVEECVRVGRSLRR
jgi:hypothetical protein